jgi:hypothetical protein
MSSHWLVVYHPPSREPVESTLLPVGIDLQAIMRGAISRWSTEGWTVEGNGDYGHFFCHRAEERYEVRIQPTDPGEPLPLNNTSAAWRRDG